MQEPKHVEGSLMKTTRTAIVIGTLLLALNAGDTFSYADQVDDLLAGKPVTISTTAEPQTGTSDAEVSVSTGDRPAVTPGTLSEDSWPVTLAEPSHVGIDDDGLAAKSSHGATAPPGMISVVPEPSAIALAVGALVYFLIFFRRRYAL